MEGIATAAKYDIISPHELFDAFDYASTPNFLFGYQHDACEALSFLLNSTGLAASLFQVGQPGADGGCRGAARVR